MKEIEYIQVGDYQLPNLKVEEMHLNRFGRAKLDYLKKHDYGLYFKLLTKNELKDYMKVSFELQLTHGLRVNEATYIKQNQLTENVLTIQGKGGYIREIELKEDLANRLRKELKNL